MRLLLVGAFPYPHHQGSQIYFQEQAIALRSAGAEITLLTYARQRKAKQRLSGDEGKSEGRSTTEHWRARDGFEHRTSPGWTSPGSLRSGPSWAKPLGDLGLAMTLRDAIASRKSNDAYDAILTHNAEAALIALHALPQARPPILYCAHTLLGNELSTYLKDWKGPKIGMLAGLLGKMSPLAHGLDRVGHGIDRWIARRVNGWISLTQSSSRVMRQFSNAPGAVIPPPVPDPKSGHEPLNPMEVARRHTLEPGRFFLYSGNLDGYQDLDILEAAAGELAERGDSAPPIVVACHDSRVGGGGRQGGRTAGWAESMPGVELLHVESASEMRALLSAARASLVMRQAEGGFPIKLVNSLAAGTPVIAFHEGEWGLTHQRNSLICATDQPALALADAIERLAHDEVLAKRLATGARALYLERHLPERVAAETLALLRKIEGFHPL